MFNILFDALSGLASSAPFFAIFAILIYYSLRRATWKRALRRGEKPMGWYPTASLGSAFQILQTFYQPSVEHSIEAREVEDVAEDDEGEPETPLKHFHRQLRRIRQGEPVDTLVWRL
jgi:hypothetical protein